MTICLFRAQGSKTNIPLIEEAESESASERLGSFDELRELGHEETLSNEDQSLSIGRDIHMIV